MSVTEAQILNQHFSYSNNIEFKTFGNLTVAEISSDHSVAQVALQGGHILTFRPREQDPVLWLSEAARFEAGKSIRGGVPVCWPWFGPHATDPQKPVHGFARTVLWKFLEIKTLDGGETQLIVELENTPATNALWSYPSQLQMVITLGTQLWIELITRNQGHEPFTIGEALHTYFQVSDVTKIRIHGLENCQYIDRVDNSQRKTQTGPVIINAGAETDRIYLDTTSDCVIEDPGLQRRIKIVKEGSQDTVIWNPWVEKANKMGDLGHDGYLKMVCVESANAVNNVVTVAPGEEHRLKTIIAVEAS